MKIRFNKFEKVAGLFVGVAILSCMVSMMGIALKNGWFSSKIHYVTDLESADGLHEGTSVQIAGLRVGSVTRVDLVGKDRVQVEFEVLEKFKSKIRQDSVVQLFRPFVLSEKVLDVSVGSEGEPAIEPGERIASVSSVDLMDLLSGKKMGNMFSSFDHLAESLKIVGEAFGDPTRMKALMQTMDRLNPLVQNLNTMSLEFGKIAIAANKQKRAENIIDSLAKVSQELEKVVPSFNSEIPDLGVQLAQIVKNLNVLTTEFKKVTPAISAIAPELPRTSRRAVEALDETVVLLKAMQRSFLFRGSVQEIQQEERQPANTSEP